MTIYEMTRRIIATNDARLEGVITRAEHANYIAEYTRIMAGHGWTWDDIEKTRAIAYSHK